jgi:dihydroorotate dehydrogenase
MLMGTVSVTSSDLRTLRVGNAAGTVKSMADVERACRSEALTDITVGSITMAPRSGNVGTTYAYDPKTRASVNALGLTNPGLRWYIEHMPEMRKLTKKSAKRLRMSIAGFTPAEYGVLAQRVRYAGADEIEINLGCPNIWSAEGKQKPIISYDPQAVSEVLDEVRHCIGTSIPIGVKISPVPNATLPGLLDAIVASGIVTDVVAVNTVPNRRMVIKGKPALRFRAPDEPEYAPWNDVGGGAGTLVAEDCLRVLRYLQQNLPIGIKAIGVGGIMDGADAAEVVSLGACGFQCATAYLEGDGPRAMNRILEEFSALISEPAD